MKDCILISILFFVVTGCATVPLSEDMRLQNQGVEELNQAHYLQAEKYFDEALSLNPKNPYTLLNMGDLYEKTDRIGAACVRYKKVIRLNPDATIGDWKSLVDVARKNFRRLGCSDAQGN